MGVWDGLRVSKWVVGWGRDGEGEGRKTEGGS